MTKKHKKIGLAAEQWFRECSPPRMPPLERLGKKLLLPSSVTSLGGNAASFLIGSGKHALLLALIHDAIKKGYAENCFKWWEADDLLDRNIEKLYLGCVRQQSGWKQSAVQAALPELKKLRLVVAQPSTFYDGNAKEARRVGKDTYSLTEAGAKVALALYDHHADFVHYLAEQETPWAGSAEMQPRTARDAGAGGAGAGAGGGFAAGGVDARAGDAYGRAAAAGAGARAAGGGRATAGGHDAGAKAAAAATFRAATAVAEKARADALAESGKLLLDDELLLALLTRLYTVAQRPSWTDAQVLTLDLKEVMASDKEGASLVKHAVECGRLQPKDDGAVCFWPNKVLRGLTAQDVTFAREAIFFSAANLKVKGACAAAGAAAGPLAGVKRPRAASSS